MNWVVLVSNILFHLSTTRAIGYYYENRGYYTANSCPMAPCPNCPTGQYMRGCAGFSTSVMNGPPPGSCTPCTAVANSLFTLDGGITDSCPFACNEGYFDSGGHCSPKIYVVQFQVAVTLTAASTFNVRKYIESMASLAGISGCAYTPTTITPNRLYETACTVPAAVIRATVDTTSTVLTNSYSRRLLATSTASVVTEIRIESNAAKATTVQQSVTVNAVNTQLTANSVGTTTTVSAPTMTIVAVVPTSSSTAKSSSTPPISTSRPDTTSKPMSTKSALLMSTTSINQDTTPAPQPPVSTPSTPSTPAPVSSSNVGIIIGAGAGGVVLLGVLIAVIVFLSMGSKKSAPNNQGKYNVNPAPAMARKLIRIPNALNANAVFVYAEVPQHLYPRYPLRHIQIQGM